MPTPNNGESEDSFVKRCIPVVIGEGTAEDGSQAAAICHSMYRKSKGLTDVADKLINYVKPNVAHIYIYDEIGVGGFTADDFIAEFKNVKPTDKVVIHVNSIGGSVIQGLTIYNLIKSHPGETEAIIEGAAGSIMSIVPLAAKKRRMYDNAVWMIHDPILNLSGNLKQIEPQLELLKGAQANIRHIYESHMKASKEEIAAWLETESYFFAEDALKLGLVHEVITHPNVSVSARSTLERLAAKFNVVIPPPLPKGKSAMDFDQWLKAECETFDMDVEKLTDKQKTAFKARFDTLDLKKTDPPSPPPRKPVEPTDSFREKEADERERVTKIDEAAIALAVDGDLGIHMNEDHLKSLGCTAKTLRGLSAHAIRKGWSVEKFELEARRASIVDVGSAAIHSRNSHSDKFMDVKATACALVRLSGKCPARQKHPITGKEWGYEVYYDQKTNEKADEYENDVSLLQIFDRAHQLAFGYRYQGRLNTDGFIAKAREALHKLKATGNTTWTSLNIFDDAANKVLWSAYEAQATTWQEFVAQVRVTDFKTTNAYRLMLTGGYQKVGPDGQLKHGGISDQKYQVAAETYGKMVGLSRADFINDDLGAFSGIMAALGEEGAKFLEELFWVQLLNNLTTLFPTNNANANYISGAGTILGVDGLTQLSTTFVDQVFDNAPILQGGDTILLTGTNQMVLAKELYTKTNLDVLQTANVKGRPNGNPHVGLFRPVWSGYMNNTLIKQRIVQPAGTAIPGQSATHFILARTPRANGGGIIAGAFLNGRTRPFVEQGDPDFNVLGMQWRAYHDVGASNGDYRLAAYSKGAA